MDDALVKELDALEARIRAADRPLTPRERVAVARLVERLDAALAALTTLIPPAVALGHALGPDYPARIS